jgi:hypothetical protein
MDELFTLHPSGVFLRREALALGYDDRALVRLQRHGLATRIRHGAYTSTHTWATADPQTRHLLRASAVMLSHGDSVALSHTTGALSHGLRLFRPQLDKVHVTRLDGGPGRVIGDVVYHEGRWSPEDVFLHGQNLVLSPVRCAFEAASLQSTESALVVLDSLLDLDLATPDEMEATFRLMRHWPKTQHVRIAFHLCGPGAESVGESRVTFLCWAHHLPRPDRQFSVHDDRGILVGTTDFAWHDHAAFGEFDGKIKYGRLLKPNQDPGDVVFLEKQREDRLREITDRRMIRFIWADLDRPTTTASRIRAMLFRRRAA